MSATILSPFDFSDAVPAGRRRFWKQILPVTSIDYDGQTIDFDPDFHKKLELAYSEKVYDQIPLVFADGKNTHNEDPRNFGGEIKAMENRGAKGTWALIEADRAAARVIRRNPRLGVSARIMQGVQKGGKVYDHAVRHVLMTMFPRVQGMEPWQAVDLSEDANVEVVDLTAESFEQEEGAMRTKTKTAKATTARAKDKTKAKATNPKIDLSALSDDEFDEFLDLAEKAGIGAVVDPDEEVVEGDEVDEEDETEEESEEPEAKVKKKKSKKVVTIENESESEGDDDEEEDAQVALSDGVEDPRFTAFLSQHAKDQWETIKKGYADAGVPPFLVDLAAPVLTQPETLDLSDGKKKTSAQAVVRGLLDGMKSIIDLTGEAGHQVDLSQVKDDEADAFVKAWAKDYR